MAKPALGKGLGHLMKGEAVGGSRPGEQANLPKLSKGFETLTKTDAPAAQRKKASLLPAWFFFAADLLLLAFTVAILFHAPKPLGWGDWVFCSITTTLAGLFGLVGVLLSAHQGS